MSEVYYTDELDYKFHPDSRGSEVWVWFKVGYKLEEHEYHPGFLSGDTSYVTVKIPRVEEFAIISFECYDDVGDLSVSIPALNNLCERLLAWCLQQDYKLESEFENYVNTAVIEAHKKYKKEGYYEEP